MFLWQDPTRHLMRHWIHNGNVGDGDGDGDGTRRKSQPNSRTRSASRRDEPAESTEETPAAPCFLTLQHRFGMHRNVSLFFLHTSTCRMTVDETTQSMFSETPMLRRRCVLASDCVLFVISTKDPVAATGHLKVRCKCPCTKANTESHLLKGEEDQHGC